MDVNALVNLCQDQQVDIPSVLELITTNRVHELFSEINIIDEASAVDRHFSVEDIDLLLKSTIEEGETTLTLPIFKIPKKGNVDARFLLNGKIFDRLLKSTSFVLPRMGIQPIDVFLTAFLRYKFVATRDATSFFYQIRIPTSLSKYLGMRIGARRGKFKRARMRRLPMGICFAPAVAQSLANMVCEILKKRMPLDFFAGAWVDNFIFGCRTEDELQQVLDAFETLCKDVSLDCKPVELINDDGFIDILGIRVYPGSHIQCLFKHEPPEQRDTPRKVMVQVGRMFWANSTVGRMPLCMFPGIMRWMRKACAGHEWDVEEDLPEQLLQEITTLNQLLQGAVLTKDTLNDDVSPTHIDWSDASCDFLGVVSQEGLEDEWWMATPTPGGLRSNDGRTYHIFIAEALAWAVIVLLNHTRAIPTLYAIDNMALTRAVVKGHSGNRIVDAILSVTLPRMSLQSYVGWVTTKLQRADKPSRDNTEPDITPWTPAEMRRCRWRRLPVEEREGGCFEGKTHKLQPVTSPIMMQRSTLSICHPTNC